MSWYGTIPMHWDTPMIRELFFERNKKVSSVDFPPLSVGKQGTIPQMERVAVSATNDNRKLVCIGDYVINSRSDRKGSSGLSAYDGSVSLIYHVLTPRDTIKGKFAHYLIRSHYFVEEFYRNGRGIVDDLWTTRFSEMRQIDVPLPAIEEQEQIVRWLGWQTSRIGKFVRAKRREIECLKELKKAVISKAITQGLNPNVEMYDSSVRWIGRTPKHWGVSTIKKHFRIVKDIAGKEGYDVLSITQQGLKVKDIESNEGQIAQSYSGYQFVHPGDFAMNHMDLITGYVDYSTQFGVTSPDYRVFRLIDETNDYPQYFLRVFQNCYNRRIFYAFGRGAAEKGRWRLPKVNFESFEVPIPPRDEQEAIAAYLDEKCILIDRLIAGLTEEINLVLEYRKRIISDAVTGKTDLRNAVVPNYEEETEIMPTDEDGNETEGEGTDAGDD